MEYEKLRTQAIVCGCVSLMFAMIALAISVAATLCALFGAGFGFGAFVLYQEYKYEQRNRK